MSALLLPALTDWLVRELDAPAAPAAAGGVFFEVERGWSARSVIAHLKSASIVRGALALEVACRVYYPGKRFKAGEYLFIPPIEARDALFRMFGGRIYLEPVTVPEGLTGQEMADLLRPGDPDGAAAFRRAFLDTGLIADLDPRARDLEGYLFPNTYNMPRKAPEADLVGAMVAGFRKVFDEGRRRRAADLGMTVRDVVTLASLIEEETALADERPLVSAVFHNRLKIGMPLQCDPTVIYALAAAGRSVEELKREDLSFASPYNTYLNPGLPPGPIASPGRDSLLAAVSPAPVKDLYFVADGTGGHRFSSSIEDHERAVGRYRRIRKAGS